MADVAAEAAKEADKDAAKSYLERNFLPDLTALHYCVTDGSVNHSGHMHINHTDPYDHIRDKQAALLRYLNDPANAKFAEGFLSVEGITDYIDRDKLDGKIKGTGYFYALCYNDIDNLLLLCGACNTKKGAAESLAWFGAQEFLGKEFVDAVRKAGGLHDGIIIRKVIDPNKKHTVDIGGVACVLHEGDSIGLGKFIDDWFDKRNPRYRKGIIKAYQACAGSQYVQRDIQVSLAPSISAQICDVSFQLHHPLRGMERE